MAYLESIASFVEDQLNGLGKLRTKKLFGALAFYCDEVLFGAVMGEHFTLKAKGALQNEFELNGMTRHKIDGKDIKMPYFNVTSETLENQDRLKELALKSIHAFKK